MSIFEQARDDLLRALLDRRAERGHTDSEILAGIVGRPIQDVTDDLLLLRDQGFVTIIGVDQNPVIHAALTPRGVQRAREGLAAVRGAPQVNQSHTFLAPGGTINVAQSGTGAVFQTIQQPAQADEARRLLGELGQAIRALDITDAEREEFLVYVEQLTEELERPEPRPSMLKIPWTGLGRIADVAGTVQGAAMVHDLVGRLGPHIVQMLQQIGP